MSGTTDSEDYTRASHNKPHNFATPSSPPTPFSLHCVHMLCVCVCVCVYTYMQYIYR